MSIEAAIILVVVLLAITMALTSLAFADDR
jgi:hypothetical protein